MPRTTRTGPARHGRAGLPTSYSAVPFAELRETMAIDKKARGSTVRFLVLDDVARPRVLTAPPEEALIAAFDAIAEVGS